VLHELKAAEIEELLQRALSNDDRGLGLQGLIVEDAAMRRLAEWSQGDARVALNALEYAASAMTNDTDRSITTKMVTDALQRRTLATDKSGESHFNMISALHKSIRGGDADASLYWLARMCEAGEDPMYIARRLVRAASEDVGNADPGALALAISAKEAVQFIGYPECKLALAQCTIYLALAPKSNAAYAAYGEAANLVHNEQPYPVPMWIRNAPTRLMKDLGYGKGYRYTHDDPEDASPQEYFPAELAGTRFYRPKAAGLEEALKERLERFLSRKPAEG
jgi:putative ATPase